MENIDSQHRSMCSSEITVSSSIQTSSIHSQVQFWQQIVMEMVAVGMIIILIIAVGGMSTASMLQPCAVLVVEVTGKVTTLSNMPDHA